MAARIAACAAAGAGLTGCVHPIADTRVDPSSPIAPFVAQAARQNIGRPRFSNIPPKPTDVPPPADFGERVRDLRTARDDLVRRTAPETWTLGETQAFAARAQSEAGPGVAGQTSTPDTEAFAASQRKRATSPPPPSN